MILYDYVLSASCYKVRLMAALVGERLDLQAVDFHPGREHKSASFRDLNPAGTLPVLVDGDLLLTESTAMLVYLATKAGGWMGSGAVNAAQVQGWLAFSARLGASLGMARLHDMLHYPVDIAAVRRAGVDCLRELESHLTEARFAGRIFLVGDGPTIADIACFPNVALAPDGGVALDDYPSIRLWMRAIRSLERFIEMPGIHRLHELKPAPEAV
ncbi:MAG: glutathione S-transferase [Rhodobacterales bacterium RIFCSPHIGHO2_02_FULL_62_130]|nr:MAG: glutathione S-transferase [Rhodobacterales bacterium RIFCSPHIGHO2_02_FULL_62_130]OHC55026.1 MAG: glutathione S-transferase [Rhodobacterales bacterium RIFCSPHIGHO2_12_FULL_62_75]HCY99523.1 glutathione S-transferase [Rhodobacter sp.]